MRRITEKGLELIKKYEGFSDTAYICPAGYLTIGFGHVVKSYEEFKGVISEEEALSILSNDIIAGEKAVLRLIRVPLSDVQFDALVSFTYNLGAASLQRSTLRQKINRSEHDDVPHEFMKWVYAGGRVLKGLIARRREEAVLYSS